MQQNPMIQLAQEHRKKVLVPDGKTTMELTPGEKYIGREEDALADRHNFELNLNNWKRHFGWKHNPWQDYWFLRKHVDEHGTKNLYDGQRQRFHFYEKLMNTPFRDPEEGPAVRLNPHDRNDYEYWTPEPFGYDAFTPEELIRFLGTGEEKQSMLDETWGKNKGYRLG